MDFLFQRGLIQPQQLINEFVSQRRRDQWITRETTNSFASAFLGENRLAGCMRGFSLVALDAIPPLRHTLARQTMGLISH